MSSTTSRTEDARKLEVALTRFLARHEAALWAEEARALRDALSVARKHS